MNSRTASIAMRSRARDPTVASIASQTTPSGTASPQDSASNNTSIARESTPAWRACPYARFNFALSDARAARPTGSTPKTSGEAPAGTNWGSSAA
jgi:hypothetical protein